MITFAQFKSRWLGNKVDYDRTYRCQCVDLIQQGLYEMDGIGSGVSGNAIDYWNKPSAPVLKAYSPFEPTTPKEGDIAIFKTKGYTGAPAGDKGDGHIGWATGQFNSTQMEILEQNGQTGSGDGVGGNEIRLRWIDRSRLAGLHRKITNPITRYEPKPTHQLQTNKQPTTWWNLNGTNKDIASFKPAAVLNSGTQFTVGGVAHHINGNLYAMEPDDYNRAINGDFSTNNGINLDDLSPIPEPPKPYTPPAAPERIPLVTYYELVSTVMTFKTATDAKSRSNPITTTDKGQYILLKEDEQARELVKKNMDRDSFWINSYDNKVPEIPVEIKEPTIPEKQPEPEPITIPDSQPPKPVVPEVHELFEGGQTIKLRSTNNIEIPVKALDGGLPERLPLPAYKELDISHWFEITDSRGNTTRYYQDDTLHDNVRFYALRADWFPDPYEVADALDKAHQQAEERVYSRFDTDRDGDITISDFIDIPLHYGKQVFRSGTAVIHTAFKSPQVKKFIDGIKQKQGTRK